jgi:hypothetical protein
MIADSNTREGEAIKKRCFGLAVSILFVRSLKGDLLG